jgi:uncharacterized protein (DUF1778 family)
MTPLSRVEEDEAHLHDDLVSFVLSQIDEQATDVVRRRRIVDEGVRYS